MHPSKVIKDPKINDTYYDPHFDKLYHYEKIGDFPPEWFLNILMKMKLLLRFNGILI